MEKRFDGMNLANYYQPPAPWTGRTDGTDAELLRWHQRIQPVNLMKAALPALLPAQKGIALLGFVCDEGVRRNKGRVGAAQGPLALRRACASFPVHFNGHTLLLDAGDITCPNNNLEEAQEVLGEAVLRLLTAGYTPILLGGGHEITYGHARGIGRFLQQQQPAPSLGLLNFDAHFDLRIPGPEGPSSGTGFWQLAQDSRRQSAAFHYLALGIQQHSNTAQLFRIATELGVQHIPADAFHTQRTADIISALDALMRQTDRLYLTIDLDVFAAPFAPGVSATAFNGILPGSPFMECYRYILQSGRLAGLDVAELNPSLDIGDRTAKLGAALIYEAVSALA